MIIKSSCIFDAVGEEPFEGYLRIQGDKIAEVAEGVPKREDFPGETILDCGDKTVMAGFCDNHVHVFLGAVDLATCNLNDAASEEEAARKLYEFYKDRDDPWVLSFGWCHYNWRNQTLPGKESLDCYFPDRPVAAVNDELHALWVNSKAMELTGISEDTKDPDYGMIQRGADGKPTGYLLEQSEMMLVTKQAFAMKREREKQLIKGFIRHAHQKGVTSVGDMEIIGILKSGAYGELEHEGELALRIFFSPSIKKELGQFLDLKKRYCSNRLALLGAKGFIDGTPLGHTGLLVEEYADRPGYLGEPVIDLEWLKEKVCLLNRHGIPVRLHACGDGAVREGLQDIEEAQKRSECSSLRNTIEHIENIHLQDLDRFAETNTIASIQPYHMSMDSLKEHPIFEILGAERCKLAWPAKTLMEHRAKVALGTDCPIVPLDPFQTIYCAVNRVMEDGKPDDGWNPAEKLTLVEALKGCTKEVAYLLGKEEQIGSLQAGKLADVIVLSHNIFKQDAKRVRGISVEKTIFNGKLVYEKKEKKNE